MHYDAGLTTKANVGRFDDDVREGGSYAYTAERLSARAANARISRCVADSFDFVGKAVLDLGCGDGAYTVEYPALGVGKVVGVDPASVAIEAATARAQALGVADVARFTVGDIYEPDAYLSGARYDCIVLRGVLHHLPDPARAIAGLSRFDGTILIVEPNGNNPVLKLLERFSTYHIEHEERSFAPSRIRNWLRIAGFDLQRSRVINLVPFFCPDWMVAPLRHAERVVERIPFLRDIACGQTIIVAQKSRS
jgi:2-polyprenyl-3-methyl-5-hydroxy-6-metoxy-1,4-benzoquinol methylase